MPLPFSHKYHLQKDFIPYKWRFRGFDTVFRSNKFPEMLFFAVNYHRIIFFRIFAGNMMNALYKNYRLHYSWEGSSKALLSCLRNIFLRIAVSAFRATREQCGNNSA